MTRKLVGTALACLLVLSAAACGQKPEVWRQIEGPVGIGGGALPAGASVDEEGNIISAEGDVIGTVEEGLDPSALEGGTGTSTGTGTGTSTGTGTGTGTGTETGTGTGTETEGETPTGGAQGSEGGIEGDTITIGIHAPLTGAAPVPSDSVDKGKDLYFRWMHETNKTTMNGYTLKAVLKNDQYNPSTAVAVCKEMVEKDNVFLLSGAAGADQLQACARYAESVGVPYISAGVTESLVSNFRTYFATTMTYPAQAPLLVDYMVNKLGAKEENNAIIFFNSSTFQDGWNAFHEAADAAGMPIAYEKQLSKNAGTSEARQIVQDMTLKQIDNAFVLTSPVFWINVLKQANTQAFRPQWVGIGISMTFDTVANVACPDGSSIEGAKFFAPFPSWSDRGKFDPDFEKASSTLTSKGAGDDFMWLSWSGGKVLWEMFESVPKGQMSRENFIASVEKIRGLSNGIGPELNFSPTDHLGADEVHVSQVTCSDRRWHTIQSFANDW